jgi:lysozyme
VDWAAGIDVSHNDGVIDWKAVANAGYRFAFIRASYAGQTEGRPHIDRQFVTNWQHAQDRGLLVTAYHYFVAQQDSTEQIDFFLNTFGSRRANFPLTLDFEFALNNVTKTQINQSVKQAVDLMQSCTGRMPMVYTGAWWWNPKIARSAQWANSDLWVANYGNPNGPLMPSDWANWKFWQWSDEGHVPGISTPVDLDWFHGSVADLRQYAGV